MRSMTKDDSVPFAGVEMHALSSAAKPVCTWMTRDAIQDCRESCAGHGYLKGIKKFNIKCVFNVARFYSFVFPYQLRVLENYVITTMQAVHMKARTMYLFSRPQIGYYQCDVKDTRNLRTFPPWVL